MTPLSKKRINSTLQKVQEYKEISSVESKELDIACLLVRICGLQTKKISEEERKTLIEHTIVLLEHEIEFTKKMGMDEPEDILAHVRGTLIAS
ncbi:hypothetical protein ACED30_20410 [Vibrio splendidus]|uniref:Uncharacterized protein n=1 Tax=Vibrio splendidus TaxID=29497 RepID=A0A2T5DWH0_VIBSP|nr:MULTISPECIES: hypothetical protein [Vibrio]MDC5722194.1 hypothetical protein [Vibrio europaeus]OEE57370.1 hypothetical protein A147_22995 [Vibrio splendidus FF-6]PTP11428.1 hypothetical protein CWO36_24785 [Vibrio splendidus]